jgi:RNA exonuclease 4
MVGLGHLGAESALARVSVVNYHGHILLDTFVATRERVTDWRTWVSGVREADLVGAPGFAEVQAKVASLLERRVVVGHALDNDLGVRPPGPSGGVELNV